MKLDFRKIYMHIKNKLAMPIEGNNLDFKVYVSSDGEINPLSTKDIRNSILDYVPCLHVEIFSDESKPEPIN